MVYGLFPHFLHLVLSLHLAQDSSDSTLLLPGVLPTYKPVRWLVNNESKYIFTVYKDCFTAVDPFLLGSGCVDKNKQTRGKGNFVAFKIQVQLS